MEMNELLDARKFVALWFRKLKGFKMKPGGNFKGNDRVLSIRMLLDYGAMVRAKRNETDPSTGYPYKIKQICDRDLTGALEEFLIEEAYLARKDILDAIQYTGCPDFELVRWLSAIIDSPTEAQINVLKHTLWLIKRKSKELPVVHHLCPVFFGLQGSGKTWAVNQLLQPVSDLKLEWDVASLTDTRNTPMLGENLVVLLDEMAGVRWADLGSLKRTITNEYLDYRVLGSHRQIKVRQNCTIIGLSNKAISDVINDQTGNRRFFQYNCKEKTDRMVLNNINVLEIWQCVDENKTRGYYELSEEAIAEAQAADQLDDERETFIKDAQLRPKEGKYVWVHTQKIYEAYLAWKPTSGFRDEANINILMLGRALQSAGLLGALKSINGKKARAVAVDPAAPLLHTDSPSLQTVPIVLSWNNKGVQS